MASRITHWYTEYNRRYNNKLRVDVYGLAYTMFTNWEKKRGGKPIFISFI